jgi:murein tripeptide amidase MpaA
MREASESPRLDKGPEGYKKLLKEFSIYVFPMINVDGVIYGNFRTNIVGSDLNRQWIEPNKWLHP